jgi:uncharacterized protein YraI
MKLKSVLVAALLLAPTAAFAAPGVVTASVGLRAGPGPGFPMVDRIPEGARVNIHGCLRGDAWCDVSWSEDRGWVSAEYLEYLYRNHYVYLPDYVDEIDVPVVPFVLNSYWASYYAGRPWYHRRAHWSSYWTSHEREATRLTLNPRAARIGRAATREGAIATGHDATTGRALATTGRVGATDRLTRRQGAAEIRGQRGRPEAAQARMMHEHAAGRTTAHVAQPMVRGHQAPRISAAPAARPAMPHVAHGPAMRHMAQPSISRGSPMNAHAQMPAPRAAAPAMPHVGGGGAPHINAAPHVGGGAPAAGPPGHQRH